mmetsp:Transcript_16882/g.23496  ORF Transcript_16882/g.23496 Transcript_16882/m.23496 type:complete len:193 (-) Transcript_16882:253-831(-)
MATKRQSKELTKRINLLYHAMFVNAPKTLERKPPLSQILPWLFLGSYRDAKDTEKLKNLQIDYVLNLAHSSRKDGDLYKPHNINYKGINADDREDFDIQQHFDDAFDFIMQAASNESNILVHCAHGVSRSATIVIAFLARISKQRQIDLNNLKIPENLSSLEDVAKFVFQKRSSICPNMGFMKQLMEAYETW